MNTAKDTRLGALMQGLVYPAFLGAGFVWTASSLASQYTIANSLTPLLTRLENYFAIWLLVYFCVPFLILTRIDLPRTYSGYSLIADFGDVVAIFLAYLGLGSVVQNVSSWPLVYWSIASIPLFAGLWNKSVGRPWRLVPSVLGLAITVPMALGGYECWPLNILAIIALWIVLIVYLRTATS
jgi:hypothetical protein